MRNGVTYAHYIDRDGKKRSVRSSWTDLDVRAGRSLRPARTTTFSYDSLVELRRVLSEVGLAGDMGRRPEAGAGDDDA